MDEQPPTVRDTDHAELKPSLPPNSVSFADVLGTHQAILGELHGMRLDMEEIRTDVKKILSTLTELAVNLTTRVEVLEVHQDRQADVCKYHHPGNGYSPPDVLGDGGL